MINTYPKNRIFPVFLVTLTVLLTTHYSLLTHPVNAQTTGANGTNGDVTIADLGVINTGTLPTSPFYFFKEWGRNFRRTITFNPIRKAELELDIANTKAAELKKVEEIEANNAEAIKNALENYQTAQEKLKARFEALKENSQNPKIDRLLENFADQAVKHQKIIDEVAVKFDDIAAVRETVSATQNSIAESASKASEKDDVLKFTARFEKALLSTAKGNLDHIRSVEIIDRLGSKAPEEAKRSLERLRAEFSDKFASDVKEFLKTADTVEVQKNLEMLPGDALRRAVIFDEIGVKAEKRVREVLDKATETIDAFARDESYLAEKAKKQIVYAEERVLKAETYVTENNIVLAVAKNLLAEAKQHLEEARSAFTEQKFGEAFGQARSAEVLARNVLNIAEKQSVRPDEFKEIFDELAIKILKYEETLNVKEVTRETQPKAYVLLDDARKHLNFARDGYAKNDYDSVKLHIGHVKGFLQDLSRFVEWATQGERYAKPLPAPAAAVSKMPVSAVSPTVSRCENLERDFKYLEELLQSGRINKEDYARKGEIYKEELALCRSGEVKPVEQPTAKPVQKSLPPTQVDIDGRKIEIACIELYQPVCGTDNKTYSNSCYAERAGAKTQYEGECKLGGPVYICPELARISEELEQSCALKGGKLVSKTDEKGCKMAPVCVTPIDMLLMEPKAVETNVDVPIVLPAETRIAEPAVSVSEFKIEADDIAFYPATAITVKKDAKVKITFVVRTQAVYYGGLDFRSPKFKTESVKPGGTTSVEFIADESFEIISYWPVSNAEKSRLKVIVE